jgi:hypothetical protein
MRVTAALSRIGGMVRKSLNAQRSKVEQPFPSRRQCSMNRALCSVHLGKRMPCRWAQASTGFALMVLVLSAAQAATAAPLPVTPDTLLEKVKLLRQSRDRPWDLASGRLGNLRHVKIAADGCTVRVVSGPENRLFAAGDSVSVTENARAARREAEGQPVSRDVTITARRPQACTSPGSCGRAPTTAPTSTLPRVDDPTGEVCFTLQVATAHDFVVGGNHLSLLFDHVDLPVLRLYLNPSAALRVWFNNVHLGMLSLSSNASALAGGSGQVEWLSLGSSQAATALLFHDMHARHVGVSTTVARARFSIRIDPDTQAGYRQPARAPGDLAVLYPIWIEGPLSALNVPVGSVDPMPMSASIRDEARGLRDEVLRRAGPRPHLPAPDPADLTTGATLNPAPLSAHQRVADVLQPYLPPSVVLNSVQLWKSGGALEGTAPDDAAVRALVQALNRSGEARHAQVAYIRNQGSDVNFRVLMSLSCAAPGERSVCLPGRGGAYTRDQVQDAVLPLLGPTVTLASLVLGDDGRVDIEGRGAPAEARAALDRIRTSAKWLQMSSTTVGGGGFTARMRLSCRAPPRADGICSVAAVTKR